MGDDRGRVCVVTGGTSGVGHGFAQLMAERGATVVLMARTLERGDDARRRVLARVPRAVVDVVAGDLSDLGATRAAVTTVRERHPKVHVLATMAGIYQPGGARTAQGHDVHVATNVMSAWLTICGLRDALLAAAPARVVLLSGNLHLKATFDPTDIGLERPVSGIDAAKRTMLYKVAAAKWLAAEEAPERITFNAVCPGFTRSGLLRHVSPPLRLLAGMVQLFAQSPRRGARTALQLATDPDLAGVSGRYFRHGRERAASPLAGQSDVQDQLVAYLSDKTGATWGG